jgi:hypothetical protein
VAAQWRLRFALVDIGQGGTIECCGKNEINRIKRYITWYVD